MSSENISPYKGSAQITREQFLFYEMRTTAKLMREGLNDDEIIDRIVADNLFQYPTEKSIRQMAKACVSRLKAMGDGDLSPVCQIQPCPDLRLPPESQQRQNAPQQQKQRKHRHTIAQKSDIFSRIDIPGMDKDIRQCM